MVSITMLNDNDDDYRPNFCKDIWNKERERERERESVIYIGRSPYFAHIQATNIDNGETNNDDWVL